MPKDYNKLPHSGWTSLDVYNLINRITEGMPVNERGILYLHINLEASEINIVSKEAIAAYMKYKKPTAVIAIAQSDDCISRKTD